MSDGSVLGHHVYYCSYENLDIGVFIFNKYSFKKALFVRTDNSDLAMAATVPSLKLSYTFDGIHTPIGIVHECVRY